MIQCGVSEFDLHAAILQSLEQAAGLDPGDLTDLCAAQRMEHHRVVNAIDEFWTEMFAHHGHHRLAHGLVITLGGELLDQVRAQIGGHDQHGVAEVHCTALAVGQAAIVQYLQQHIEHVGVRFFDFIEQNHAVRPAANLLGQVTAFLIADVAGRGANQPRH